MNITEHRQGGAVVLRPAGAITGADADRLGQRLADVLEGSGVRVVVDMARVTLLDSRALEVLVEATEKLIRGGKALILVSANDVVREVLELTDVASLFEQYDDLDAAMGSRA
jgi:anti-sigma B factor antagonist